MATHTMPETGEAVQELARAPDELHDNELLRQRIMYLAEKWYEEKHGIPVHSSMAYKIKRFFVRLLRPKTA